MKTTSVLAALCGLLAVVLAVGYALGLYGSEPEIPAPAPPIPQEQTGEAPPPDPATFRLPEISHYDEMAERPLFVQGRRVATPAPEPAPPPPPPPARADFTLVGVVLADGTHIALLQDEGGKIHRLGKGQEALGWQVIEVLPDNVKLTDGTQETRLFLRKKSTLPRIAPRSRNDSPPASEASPP